MICFEHNCLKNVILNCPAGNSMKCFEDTNSTCWEKHSKSSVIFQKDEDMFWMHEFKVFREAFEIQQFSYMFWTHKFNVWRIRNPVIQLYVSPGHLFALSLNMVFLNPKDWWKTPWLLLKNLCLNCPASNSMKHLSTRIQSVKRSIRNPIVLW